MATRFRQMTARLVASVGVASVAALALGAPAQAADDFGQHVRTCAQEIGFSGAHNPGMHQGKAGWSPGHTC